MTEYANTPELRFPEFKDEWKLQKLGNLAQFSKGKSLSKKDLNINGNPCILYGELYTKYGAILNKVYSKTSTQNDSLVFSKRNQILIPSSGETDIDIATATAVDTDVKIAIGGDLNIITPINSDGRFISLYINGKGKYNLAKYAQGKSVVHLYNSDIKKLNFYLPTNVVEQKKIGNFFSKLDRQIELEEEKLELLEQQKKGYMQKVFSQELRFKDENGNDYPDWKLKKLSNVADIIGGGTPSTKKSEYWDGDINWFSPVEIGDKEFVSTSQRRITEKGLEKSSAKMLPIGTVLFTSRAGIGKTAILSKEATTNQGFQSIVPKENDLDSYFLYSMTSILKRKAEKVGAGSTFSEVSRKQMEQIKLLIPILKEQKQIGRLFQIINRKINKQIHKIELLKHRKQGLLQKMFV
ncbi:restriction endonuclease subunit S [Staphylococcus hominis]|uniref:restriction endonuclease subunit S n=1 Tax=Staphylococcus TaxID=1279 RepID=UPI0019EEE206|nr:restriction endonuclease subunit S [Staphylococcus hominis]EGQ3904120.1 restriction endonuclease subunit S [Staphylococcus pseudintermedius]MCI2869787.1 restriction endonuclease subunit S [Staphylococcus hominis]MDS3894286.1 restriction endonuclease subunit S [Staphylococcus hominis]